MVSGPAITSAQAESSGPAGAISRPRALGCELGAFCRHLPLRFEAAAVICARTPAAARLHMGQDPGRRFFVQPRVSSRREPQVLLAGM